MFFIIKMIKKINLDKKMKFIKILVISIVTTLMIACSQPPDYTGEWEQTNGEEPIKRFLTITQSGEKYHILDELKDSQSGEVTYDEKSNGVLDGKELLTGTNLLTNVLSFNERTQELTMQTHDESTLVFKKIAEINQE